MESLGYQPSLFIYFLSLSNHIYFPVGLICLILFHLEFYFYKWALQKCKLVGEELSCGRWPSFDLGLEDNQGNVWGAMLSTSQRACPEAGLLGEVWDPKSSLILDFQGQESKPLLGFHHYSISVGTKPLPRFSHIELNVYWRHLGYPVVNRD